MKYLGKIQHDKDLVTKEFVESKAAEIGTQLVTNYSLTSVLHFKGTTTVNIVDGSNTNPNISGYTTRNNGDIIINSTTGKEYVYSNNAWHLLGPVEIDMNLYIQKPQSAVEDQVLVYNGSNWVAKDPGVLGIYQYGTEDLIPGVSDLADGTLYFYIAPELE